MAVAGVVHGQEFVVNADATAKNRAWLEAINSGMDPMVHAARPSGSFVPQGGSEKSAAPNVQVINNGAPLQPQRTEWDGETMRLYVDNRVAAGVNAARAAVAADARDHSSPLGKGLRQTYRLQPQRDGADVY